MNNICKRIKIDKQYKYLVLAQDSEEKIQTLLSEEKFGCYLPITEFYYDPDFYTAYNVDEKIFEFISANLNEIKVVCPVLIDEKYYKTHLYRARAENLKQYSPEIKIVKPYLLFKNKNIIAKYKLLMV